MRGQVLAVVDPMVPGFLDRLMPLRRDCKVRLEESEQHVVFSVLTEDFDELLLNPMLFFDEDTELLQWINFLRPELKITLTQ